MRARDNRLGRVKQAIEVSPVRRGVLREAYEWFRDFGEFDDDDHVAYEVVQQALRGGEEQAPEDEARLARRVHVDKSAYQRRDRPAEAWPPTVRNLLFDEALFEEPGIRRLARAAIALEVAHGGDVEPGVRCAPRHPDVRHSRVAHLGLAEEARAAALRVPGEPAARTPRQHPRANRPG